MPLRFLSQVTQSRLLRSVHNNKATTSRADCCVDALHTCGGAASFAFFGFFAFFATLSPQTTRAGWRAAEVQTGSPQTRGLGNGQLQGPQARMLVAQEPSHTPPSPS